MACTAERTKAMRQRRQARGVRELRTVIPEARDPAFWRQVAEEVAGLDLALEEASMRWIEGVSLFDEGNAPW